MPGSYQYPNYHGNAGFPWLLVIIAVLIIVVLLSEWSRLRSFGKFAKHKLYPQEGDEIVDLLQRMENNIHEPTPRVYWRRCFLIGLAISLIVCYWLLRRLPTLLEYTVTFLVVLIFLYFLYSFYDYHDSNVYRIAARANLHLLQEKLGVKQVSKVGVESTLIETE